MRAFPPEVEVEAARAVKREQIGMEPVAMAVAMELEA
jgi:hypothetical protein